MTFGFKVFMKLHTNIS